MSIHKNRKDGKEEVAQSEAAWRLGISAQALGVWARRPGAPVVLRKGKPFCLWPDFPRWRDAEMKREKREGDRPQSSAEADRREQIAKAELAELKVAQMREDLVPAALHQQRLDKFVGGFAAMVGGRLQRFERDIVRASTPAEARRVTQAIQDQLLQGAQDYATELEAEPEDDAA